MIRNSNKKRIGVAAGAVVVAAAILAAIYVKAEQKEEPVAQERPKASLSSNSVSLTDQQLTSVKVSPASLRDFSASREAVGYIDFNQDRTVPVFSPWSGRIRQVFVKAGDDVRRGTLLFSIDSPDLVQAESTLIATTGVLRLTAKALGRIQKMRETDAAAQKDLDQAQSDEQSAEANYRAARDALRIFGKTDAEIDRIVAERRTDGELQITSPVVGRVVARSAAPGLLVQPGSSAPAPLTIADLSTMWVVANVTEYDLPALKLGQDVSVTVPAYPGRKFKARVTNIAAAVDPTTHRIAVRSELADPGHELRPQMLATFVIITGGQSRSIAIPLAGVVREGDGSMAVFVTSDGRRFERRNVQVGTEQDGFSQIVGGLEPGERVATDGALFLSNALALQSR